MSLPSTRLKTLYFKKEGDTVINEVPIAKAESTGRKRVYNILARSKNDIFRYLESKNSNTPIEVSQHIFGANKFSGCENVFTMRWKNLHSFETVAAFLKDYNMRPIHQEETVEKFRRSDDFLLSKRVVEGGDLESEEEMVLYRDEDGDDEKMGTASKQSLEEIDPRSFIDLLSERDKKIASLQKELQISSEKYARTLRKYKISQEVRTNVFSEKKPRTHKNFLKWLSLIQEENKSFKNSQRKLFRRYGTNLVCECWSDFGLELLQADAKRLKSKFKI